jgi:hypothetical protein
VFSAAWFFCVAKIIWPDGIKTTIGNLGIASNSKSNEIVQAFGTGDAGYLLQIAKTWSQFSGLSEINQFWIVRLWAPGLSMIEIPMLWLEAIGVPLFWTFSIVLVIVWTLGFYLFWRYIKPLTGIISALIFVALFTQSWDFKYLFRDGIFYTEAFAYILLFYSLFQISYICIRPDTKYIKLLIIVSGFCLGASVYVRHTHDAYIFLVGIVGVALFYAKRRSHLENEFNKNISVNRKKFNGLRVEQTLMLYAFVAFLTTLPWRLISTFHFKGAPLQMSSGFSLFGNYIWADPKSEVGKYWESYGSNWACRIDQSKCLRIQESLQNGETTTHQLILEGILSALSNPLDYLRIRVVYANKNWIPNFPNLEDFSHIVALIYMVVFVFIIFCTLAIKSQQSKVIALIWTPLILVQCLQFTIIHFESRYFIALRFTAMSYLLLLIATRSKRSINEDIKL